MIATQYSTRFNLNPGRVLAGKYEVQQYLGSGCEGEVYRVVERLTGAPRAAKLFFPGRNGSDHAFRFYARKLEGLRHCSLIIQYHHSESIRIGGESVSLLLSEFVDGTILRELIDRSPGKRLPPFEALSILRTLASGLAEIHAHGEYHGDLHEANVLIRRRGVHFDAKFVDIQDFGHPSKANRQEDVCQLVRLLYEMVGGRTRYPKQPPEIRSVCCGLKRSLILRRFPTADALRNHLDEFEWAGTV